VESGVYAAAARTEARIKERAAAAGMGLAAYRNALRKTFRERFEKIRRFQT
jgi:hypothetical protein